MKKELVIFGAGGFGREMMWQIGRCPELAVKYDILGFTDDAASLYGKIVDGFPVIGTRETLASFDRPVDVFICIANPAARREIFAYLSENPLISFPPFVADNAVVAEPALLGRGAIICVSCVLTVNVTIGEFAIIDCHSVIGHDSVIGDYSTVYPSASIAGHVTVGLSCEIGTGACIIQGITVGKRVILGAGAVAISDIPPECTAVGVPAKPVKFR
ncbi:MAG: acetyltransferase [Oscillospiraceae bacterium]|nr:acetyltransferase [Oscillospiraceae bacterium]